MKNHKEYTPFCQWPNKMKQEASQISNRAIRKGENGVIAALGCLLVILILVVRSGGCSAPDKTPSYGSKIENPKQK